MSKKLELGIYDKKNYFSIKIVNLALTQGGQLYATMYYTNNPTYGKMEFGLEGNTLKKFMRGYKKRPQEKRNVKIPYYVDFGI